MKQIVESLLKMQLYISNIFYYKPKNSHNKTENHFHGPVTFIQEGTNKKMRLKSKN